MSSSGGRTRSTTAAAAGRSSSRARRRAALSCVSSPPTTPPCCAMASGRPPSPSASSSPGTAAAPEPSCSDPAECSTRSLCSPSRHRSCALGSLYPACVKEGRGPIHGEAAGVDGTTAREEEVEQQHQANIQHTTPLNLNIHQQIYSGQSSPVTSSTDQRDNIQRTSELRQRNSLWHTPCVPITSVASPWWN
ncbi:hypothetical protein ACQJBY_071160 [Aegilops geniculata]